MHCCTLLLRACTIIDVTVNNTTGHGSAKPMCASKAMHAKQRKCKCFGPTQVVADNLKVMTQCNADT
jgi:hypothetical protein